MTMAHPQILSVGQCAFDHRMIAHHLQTAFEAQVSSADTAAEAIERLRSSRFDLVLVNRVGDLDGSSGLDLIQALKADPALAGVPVMLVSNHADAQAKAIALGALVGFGKAELQSPATLERVARAIGQKR
jgi:two-component system chemotaxis response regulator CheY